MAQYSFAKVRKAVVALVGALAASAGSVALALNDFPELAIGVTAAGTVLTGVLTFFVKNEKLIDQGVEFGDNAFGLD